MQIVSSEQMHEMSKPFFSGKNMKKKIINLSSGELEW